MDSKKDKERQKFVKIGEILPSLVGKGFISDLESRIIASSGTLSKRRKAFYKIIDTRHPLDTTDLFAEISTILPPRTGPFDLGWRWYKWLKNAKKRLFGQKKPEFSKSLESLEITERVIVPFSASFIRRRYGTQTTMQCCTVTIEEKNENTQTKAGWTYSCGNNPLLHYPVGKCIFEYLPVSCIKKCRIVCQEWNSTAEIFLRTQGTIYFEPESLRPTTFLETFSNSLPNLPFTAFTINLYCVGEEHMSELDDFFIKYGNNIKKLTLYGINKEREIVTSYDVTPWILMTPNIIYLRIESWSAKVQWNKLPTKISHLELVDCVVRCENNNGTKIKPVKITLKGVSFRFQELYIEGQLINLNDYIDFSQASEITIQDSKNGGPINLTNQVFNNTQKVLLQQSESDIDRFVDWQGSSGKIFKLDLVNCQILRKIDVQIQQLIARNSTIDLSLLPMSLEKIQLKSETTIRGFQTYKSNLKFLRVDVSKTSTSCFDLFCFSMCFKLVDLELRGDGEKIKLDLFWMPRSVKRLKMVLSYSYFNVVKFAFRMVDLNILILENCDHNFNTLFKFAKKLISKIKLKVLVISCNAWTAFAPGGNTADIIQFVEANQHLEKIIIGYGYKQGNDGLHNIPFYGSVFSQFVDKKANFYQFEKLVGKSLSRAKFQSYRKLETSETG